MDLLFIAGIRFAAAMTMVMALAYIYFCPFLELQIILGSILLVGAVLLNAMVWSKL